MDEGAKTPEAVSQHNLRPYLASHAGWYGALGLQVVLFPYLAAVVLDLPARYIGFAQMALMGPGLLFMLPGGALVDQIDERKHLIRLHLLASLPPFIMAGFLFADRLTYEVLLFYAFVVGSCTAFATPARDAMLNHIVEHKALPRAVAAATITQFAAQMVGMAIAGSAGQLGPGPFVLAHGLFMVIGGILVARIKVPESKPSRLGARNAIKRQWADIVDAFREIRQSHIMWPVLCCNLAVGICFVGAFLVVVPIIVRDVYLGGAAQIALLNVGFWAGSIISSMIIMRRGGVRRRGRVIFGCLTFGTVTLAAMMLPLPFYLLLFLMLLWGCGGGAVMTLSRTIVQEAAPASHRGRIMAVYQMGFMGGGPIGALSIGFLIDGFGPRLSILFPALAMATFLVVIVWKSHLWKIEAHHSAA